VDSGGNTATAILRQETATIFCDEGSSNARSIFANAGFRFAPTPEEADLIWLRKGYTAWCDRFVRG